MTDINPKKTDYTVVTDHLEGLNINGDLGDLQVLHARARTVCPPGRMGSTCSYLCQSGWRKSNPTDGNGGYLQPIENSKPIFTGDVYDNFLPSCMIPTGCGFNCSVALNQVLVECLEYMDDFTQATGCKVIL